MPSLNQLKYIVAVADYGSFVLAAEKCFVTQPTLSMQIRKLEEELGIVIFDRTKHPITTTPIGKKIVEQARKVVKEAEKVPEIINEFKGKVTGNISIGIIPTIAPYLIHRFIGNFARKYPLAKLHLYEMITDDIVKDLKNYKLDIGIVSTPLKEQDIKEIPVYYEKILLYINKNHELATKEYIHSSDLKNYSDVWLLTQGHCFRYHIINLCELENTTGTPLSNIQYESGSLESLFRLVEEEKGLTLFPELALDYLNNNGKAVIRELDAIIPLREISIIHKNNYVKNNLLNALEKEIINTIPEEMTDPERGTVVEWK